MSMNIYYNLEFFKLLLGYSFFVMLLPMIAFNKYLKKYSIYERILIAFVFGNFYIINLVFILELLHISNFISLMIGTFGPWLYFYIKNNNNLLKDNFNKFIIVTKRLTTKQFGLKLLRYKIYAYLNKIIIKAHKFIFDYVTSKSIETVLLIIIIISIWWVYGRQLNYVYAYQASDIPVHMYWINQMSYDNIFVAGVYPFGFHCIIYYLHTIIGSDTFVIMCQFYLLQVILMHFILLIVLKLLCKNKYLAYLGVFVYCIANFWSYNSYSRFFSSLPQEYGMIFVIPSIYFLIKFFMTPNDIMKGQKFYTNIYSMLFGMSFSLTLAIHFYGTMIAGMACIGIALAFFVRFVNIYYFRHIMLIGILSISIAVAPMLIAYVSGTPLQGSLGWGLGVISGSRVEVSNNNQNEIPIVDSNQNENIDNNVDNNSMNITDIIIDNNSKEEIKVNSLESIKNKIINTTNSMIDQIGKYSLDNNFKEYAMFIFISLIIIIFIGLVLLIFRQYNYGSTLIGAGLTLFIIAILLNARYFKLPTLMDAARLSIYFNYLYIFVPILIIDSVLLLFTFYIRINFIKNAFSLVITILGIFYIISNNCIKNPTYNSNFVTNEAFKTLVNIIHDEEDYKWTIISANDETQMAYDHGYHYESFVFLDKIKRIKLEDSFTIPTHSLYFFIEKIPLDYRVSYQGSGQAISQKAATMDLPHKSGITMYMGEKRWIIMSKLYYYVQALKEMYPNEVLTYFENDNFVCYKMIQNDYHLYDLAIDYGYNQIVN